MELRLGFFRLGACCAVGVVVRGDFSGGFRMSVVALFVSFCWGRCCAARLLELISRAFIWYVYPGAGSYLQE